MISDTDVCHILGMHPGTLDEPFVEVAKVWSQEDHGETGLQNRQPAFGRHYRDAAISRERRVVE